MDKFTDALKNGQTIRLVGDNVNWMLKVHDERIGHVGHLQHAFASAVIVNEFNFDHLPDVTPQKDCFDLNDFLLNQHDIDEINREYSIHIGRIVTKMMPYFEKFASSLPKFVEEPHDFMNKTNNVIPLPVVMKNEQSYKDVVDILDNYESLIHECFKQANIPVDNVKIHIAGDQLTRERFSGAKRLRAHHLSACDRYDHLGPITFGFFHMHMSFIQLIFDELYDSRSVTEIGTLKFLQERMCRLSVNADVKKAFDADKEFVLAVKDVYCAAAVMQHFGMEKFSDMPSKNICPDQLDENVWFKQQLSTIVNNFVCLSPPPVQNEVVEGI